MTFARCCTGCFTGTGCGCGPMRGALLPVQALVIATIDPATAADKAVIKLAKIAPAGKIALMPAAPAEIVPAATPACTAAVIWAAMYATIGPRYQNAAMIAASAAIRIAIAAQHPGDERSSARRALPDVTSPACTSMACGTSPVVPSPSVNDRPSAVVTDDTVTVPLSVTSVATHVPDAAFAFIVMAPIVVTPFAANALPGGSTVENVDPSLSVDAIVAAPPPPATAAVEKLRIVEPSAPYMTALPAPSETVVVNVFAS
ncbi:MAG: hypothetical protein JO103_01525 [Candidatus Eremiobacteraeota bacterium]|nr:hypothetical protein [Candidatus Eremiobacteraeota bacterium]